VWPALQALNVYAFQPVFAAAEASPDWRQASSSDTKRFGQPIGLIIP
jgi:hypothetical protein